MSERPAVIRVNGVSKDFRFSSERTGTIKGLFTGLFRRKHHEAEEVKIQHALKDVSFDIKKGEFFGIVGRNGSGKSTMLKMLAGIYQPTEGDIHVEGKLVPFIELGVGFNPELTGKENVYLNGALLGFGEDEVAEFYDEVVEFAELEQFMDKKLKNYSSGMQVRLAFAMAIRAKADILLIDEVLAVGDADFQRKCFNYFSKLKKDKATVVFVSHDMSAIREYCDRAILLEKSEIIAKGKTDQVAQKYLKLFTPESTVEAEVETDSTEQDENERWGDGSVITDKIKVNVTEKLISIKQTIKAKKDFEDAIGGYRIRDASGKDICGSNTKHENVMMPLLKKGDKVELVWEMANILSDGDYILDVAVLHKDEITASDWWNESARFKIRKDRHLPYSIDPELKVKLTQ